MKLVRSISMGILLSLAPSSAESQDTPAGRFRALEEAWSNAIKAQDQARLEQFLRPEYTLTVARAGKPLASADRASWLKSAVTTYVIHEFQFNEIGVREYGNIAVVTARYAQKATINGRFRSDESFLTDVWVKTGNQWQVSRAVLQPSGAS